MSKVVVTDPLFPECPVRNILSRIGEKWCLLILLNLRQKETLRFNELHKLIPDISQRMLTRSLQTLQADGLVHRESYAEVPVRVEYNLTDRALELLPLIEGLVQWSLKSYSGIIHDRTEYIAKLN